MGFGLQQALEEVTRRREGPGQPAARPRAGQAGPGGGPSPGRPRARTEAARYGWIRGC
jgi:hypothetical protein